MLRGLVVIVGLLGAVGGAGAALTTQNLAQGLDPGSLANVILGSGVVISNVRQTGCPEMLGTFAGGNGIVGLGSGLVMSSGGVAGAVGPNVFTNLSSTCDAPGDLDLDALVQQTDASLSTFDAAVLEFDFVPEGDTVAFQYVFGSEEYPEFVGTPFNDVFGFFVNGMNLALLPGTALPVTVNNVNADVNGVLFIPNDGPTPLLDTEADGLTQVLSFAAPVLAGQTNHIKLAIADTADFSFDSWIFIGASSLSSTTADVALTVKGKTALLDVDIGATGRGLGSAEAAGFARTDTGAASIVTAGAVTAPAGLTAVTKNVRRRFNKQGRARVRLRLNRTGKRLLKDNGSLETLVVLRVTNRENRAVDFQRVITFRR